MPSRAFAAPNDVPLNDTIKCVAGDWNYRDREFSVAGKLFQARAGTWEFAIFNIKGYDRFASCLGLGDDDNAQSATIRIEVDGELAQTETVRRGQKAKPIEIKLTGHQTLTLRSEGYLFIEPKLIKGGAPSKPPAPGGAQPAAQPAAPFSLDPSGLDTLAKSLWDQCQAKAKVKSKVENGNVAVATFKSIGSLPAQIPASVAADLYTAMIKSKFELVERAQLDKVLGELKIQDTALIDPATAKKIGKLAGCDLMLVGEITDSDALVVINARLMETETGKSVVAERVQLRKIFSRS